MLNKREEERQRGTQKKSNTEIGEETERDRETERHSKGGRDTEKESRARQTDGCRDTVTGRLSERQKDTKGGKRERETHRSRVREMTRADVMTPAFRPGIYRFFTFTLLKLSLDPHSCLFLPSLWHRAVLLNLELGS